jgi:hypothetical protein
VEIAPYTPPVKYVEWVELVARTFAGLPNERQILGVGEVAAALGQDPQSDAVQVAIEDLDAIGILELDSWQWLKPSQATRAIRDDAPLSEVWSSFFAEYVDPEQTAALEAAVAISEERRVDDAEMRWVDAREVWERLGSSADEHDPHFLMDSLRKLRLVTTSMTNTSVHLRPTYRGVVRATERQTTEWQERLVTLVEEWETATVDFKQQVDLGNDKLNAGFARDVTALANTKASGAVRLLVMGYDDDTRQFIQSLDPSLTLDRVQDVLNAFVAPALDLRLRRIHHPARGEVGVLEVHRDQAKLPYRVTKDGGKIKAGSVFVRHGSHVEPPTEDERLALEAEGTRARGQDHPR